MHHAILLRSLLTAFICLSARNRLPPFSKSNIRIEAIGLARRLPYPKSHGRLFSTARSGNRSSRSPAHRDPQMALDDEDDPHRVHPSSLILTSLVRLEIMLFNSVCSSFEFPLPNGICSGHPGLLSSSASLAAPGLPSRLADPKFLLILTMQKGSQAALMHN